MIRTRFAPSPTGYLHIGGARTALFSWAFARKHGGKFILRIEDTDRERSTEESVKAILDGMNWLGLDYDEGPFYQMDRLARYHEVADRLIKEGKAYYCYCSKEELEATREAQRAAGLKPRYDGRCKRRTTFPDVEPVVRLKNPTDGTVTFNDLVKGEISVANSELDDLVLLRADGIPTYNFGVVIDDLDMNITHVIRGDDHVNNTPRQINILKAMNAPIPEYAHLPMILGSDGERLSKRHGAVSVMQYQEDGYLPNALINYLARLGWSHGDEEIFSREQLVEWFDLAHINHAPAKFDPQKLTWVNEQYLKSSSSIELKNDLEPFIDDFDKGPAITDVIELLKDRVSTLVELAESASYFYKRFSPSDELRELYLTKEVKQSLISLVEKFKSIDWNKEEINKTIKQTAKEHQLKMPQIAMAVRVLVTGQTQTPSIDAVLELLGRKEVLARLS